MPQWAYKWNMPPCQATVPHDLSQNSPAPCSLPTSSHTHTHIVTQSQANVHTRSHTQWSRGTRGRQTARQTLTCIQRALQRGFFFCLPFSPGSTNKQRCVALCIHVSTFVSAYVLILMDFRCLHRQSLAPLPPLWSGSWHRGSPPLLLLSLLFFSLSLNPQGTPQCVSYHSPLSLLFLSLFSPPPHHLFPPLCLHVKNRSETSTFSGSRCAVWRLILLLAQISRVQEVAPQPPGRWPAEIHSVWG